MEAAPDPETVVTRRNAALARARSLRTTSSSVSGMAAPLAASMIERTSGADLSLLAVGSAVRMRCASTNHWMKRCGSCARTISRRDTAASMRGMSPAVAAPSCGKTASKVRAARAICVLLCASFRPRSARSAKDSKAFGETPFEAARASRAAVSRLPYLASASARAAAMVAAGRPTRLALSAAVTMFAASRVVANSTTEAALSSAAMLACTFPLTPASCVSGIPASAAVVSANKAESVSFAAKARSMRDAVSACARARTAGSRVAFSGKPPALANETARITASYSLAVPLGNRLTSASIFAATRHPSACFGTRAWAKTANSTAFATQSTSAATRQD
mmetsp:Transcript_41423/g.119264  ORF Transcript_41423/g.119264 Transcript_41423/m.119264 type:complete len:336 (-) Transcript_41423:1291-2298(-)